jgi:hypothetical protein
LTELGPVSFDTCGILIIAAGGGASAKEERRLLDNTRYFLLSFLCENKSRRP